MNWWVLRRQIHTSWHIAILSTAIIIGVWIAGRTNQASFASLTWVISALLVTLVVLARRYLYLMPILVIAGLIIGLWRGSLQGQDLAPVKQLIGRSVSAVGRVKEDVDPNAEGVLALRLNDLSINNSPVAGSLWVTLAMNENGLRRSDVVTVEGKLTPGFGSFVATMYEANLQRWQRPQPGDVALSIRDEFGSVVRKEVSEPQASLGLGYLVGQKSALPEDLSLALQVTGLTHVVVASGYNLTILVRLARRLFEKVSKYLATAFSGLMIASFVAITGLSPSMSRAALVASLSLAAWYYGRRFHPLVLLPMAAAITVLINPTYAWNDLGWQLSFAAFAGVMILAPLVNSYWFADRPPSALRRIFVETMSAFIMTAPILIAAFGQISNIAVVTNLLILPLVPLAMLITFVAGLGGWLASAVAGLIAWPANLLLGYMIQVVTYFASLPWAMREITIGVWGQAVAYAVIIGLMIYLSRVTRHDLSEDNLVV